LHTDRGALPQVLRQLPAGLPLVLDHMARPHAVSALDPTVQAVRQWRGPVHVKLSGAYRLGGLDPAALAALWLQERGPQHLLWGSDWPCTNHEHAAHYPHLLEALFDWVGHGHAQAILSDNPRALYWA
jgi:predicted TIM-barrel fold metal-dependent hydrolase